MSRSGATPCPMSSTPNSSGATTLQRRCPWQSSWSMITRTWVSPWVVLVSRPGRADRCGGSAVGLRQRSEPDRQAVAGSPRAGVERNPDVAPIIGPLQTANPFQQFLDHDAERHPGHVGADAAMRPGAEGHHPVAGSVDDELLGAIPFVRIDVGRQVVAQHPVVLADQLAADLDVLDS